MAGTRCRKEREAAAALHARLRSSVLAAPLPIRDEVPTTGHALPCAVIPLVSCLCCRGCACSQRATSSLPPPVSHHNTITQSTQQVEVTWEDQQNINNFSKLNLRRHELESLIAGVKVWISAGAAALTCKPTQPADSCWSGSRTMPPNPIPTPPPHPF
jgi:hypothetical protein